MSKTPRKAPRRKWELDKDSKYLKDLENDPAAAAWLSEFEAKYHCASNDHAGDLIPPRTDEEKSEDYHRSYANKNDLMNGGITSFDEEVVIKSKKEHQQN